MTSWSAAAVHFYVSNFRRSKATYDSAQATEASLQALYLRPQSHAPPNNLESGLEIKRVDINTWPLYHISSMASRPGTSQQEVHRTIVYIHGGAFYREIDPYHWPTAEQVINGVIDICRSGKYEVVCIAGDSAGGAIALATVQQIQKDAHEIAKKLQSVVLISPVLDCTLSHPENLRLAANDPWLGIEGVRAATKRWAGDLLIEDSRVSPLFGSITDLPPILLFSGTADLLCADARRLSARFQGKSADNVAEGSVEVEGLTYVECHNMIHVYPILPHWEGGEARKQIVAFVNKHSV